MIICTGRAKGTEEHTNLIRWLGGGWGCRGKKKSAPFLFVVESERKETFEVERQPRRTNLIRFGYCGMWGPNLGGESEKDLFQ